MFRRAVFWAVVSLAVHWISAQGDPCPEFSCKHDGDNDCWRQVGSHADVGQVLAKAGHMSAAITCFTRAANGVQDQRWLPVQHQLSPARRLLLSRLYTAAASTILASGQTSDLQTWLRRAVQISAPSAEVLFEEDEPPDTETEIMTATADHDEAPHRSWSKGNLERKHGMCAAGDAERMVADGRWEDGLQCMRETIFVALEGGEVRKGQLAGLLFQYGATVHLAAEHITAASETAARLSVDAVERGGEYAASTEAVRSMRAAQRLEGTAELTFAAQSDPANRETAERRWRVRYMWPMTIGDVLVREGGKEREALVQYAMAMRTSMGDVKAAVELLPPMGFVGTGRMHSDICALCRLTKRLQLALHHCDSALLILDGAAAEDPAARNRLLADAHFNKAVALFDLRRFSAAARELRRSASYRAGALDCLLYLGYALLNAEMQRWWESIRQDPGNASWSLVTAENDFMAALLDAQSLAPDDPNTYMALAQALMSLGMPDAASAILLPIAQDAAPGSKDPFYVHLAVDPAMADTAIQQLRVSSVLKELQWKAPRSEPCSDGRQGAVPRSAIVYLTSDSSSDLTDLAMSLKLLRSNLLDVHGHYPVIVFHDSLHDFHMQFLRSALGTGCAISFEHVSLEAPSTSNSSFRFFHQAPNQGVGYRSMCRFFSGPLFEHPAMRELDYYMRMDTDSFFLRPLPYDPFQRIVERSAVYGFLTTATEEGSMCVGLAEEMAEAVDLLVLKGVIRKQSSKAWDRTFFYNNFEITAVQFWRSDAYRSVFKALDASGGFFSRRWGDGPVRTIALSLLADPSRVVKLTGISYWHQNFVTLPLE